MISKREAKYQTTPRKGKMCSMCSMFRQPTRCTLVTGYILPKGWCEHFEPKKNNKSARDKRLENVEL